MGVDDSLVVKFFERGFTPEITQDFIRREGSDIAGLNDLLEETYSYTTSEYIKNGYQTGESWFEGKEYQQWTANGFRFETMKFSARYGGSLGDAIMCVEAGFSEDDYLKILKEEIEVASAIHLRETLGYDVDGVIQHHADQAGISVVNRSRYVVLGQGPFRAGDKNHVIEGMSQPTIELMVESGMTPEILSEYSSFANVRKRAVKLVEEGKLNGDIFNEWASERIDPYDTLLALEHDYSLPGTIPWIEAGFSVWDRIRLEKHEIGLGYAKLGKELGRDVDAMIDDVASERFTAQYFAGMQNLQ